MSGEPSTQRLEPWLAALRAGSGLQVRRIPLAACRDWSMAEGTLRHVSGRYFSIVGTQCHGGHAGVDGLASPMIDQPEVGILGFVVHVVGTSARWLLQGKTEPGNVLGTQVGPSVQATFSNYMRVHGGKPTALLEHFRSPAESGAEIVSDSLQSEQGDRFIHKHNRNMVVRVAIAPALPAGDTLAWFDAAELRRALLTDFAVNTDARSVLCCSDWRLLADDITGEPFARWRGQGGFGEALHQSSCDGAGETARQLAETLDAAAASRSALRLARCPLAQTDGWRFDEWGIVPEVAQGQHEVQTFAVHARDREVSDWCQPLMVATRREHVALVCSRREGLLRFLVREAVEPGFLGAWQLGPSLQTGSGHSGWAALERAVAGSAALRHASVLQSDEGGRFGQSVARYEIVELQDAPDLADGPAGHWLSLAELSQLAARPASLTNELRSVMSMLLAWA